MKALESGRRGKILLIALVVCVSLTSSAFWLGQQIKSPEQRAAEAEPPEYTEVTAAVESRTLMDSVQIRGSVAYESGARVDAGEVAGAGRLVVTDIGVGAGDEVESGQVLVEVAERPILVLEGEISAFRDLAPGLEGDDVAQLQAALTELGYSIGDPEGHYGASTASAVRSLYAELGYDAIEAGDGAVSGPMVPLSEIVFAVDLPVTVDAVSVTVNDVAAPGEPLLSLAQGNLGVSGEVSLLDAEEIEPGMKVLLSADGEELEGAVAAIEKPETEPEELADGGEGGEVPVLHVRAEVPPEWQEAEVWLTVVLSETDGDVMAVPQTAVYTSADGATSVLRKASDGSEKVPVELGSTGDGYIQVISPDLAVGDTVVVGQR
jgi:peptidoglycan hydrolase-like protein with peptidoglycan-binding domain